MSLPLAIERSLELVARHRLIRGEAGGAEAMSEVIERVRGILDELEISWALVGAHAVGVLTEPRATSDFDLVVEGARMGALLTALREEFGELGEQDIGAAVRLAALDLDLIRSTTHPLFAEVLADARPREAWPIPTPELMMVLKFLASVSPWRRREARVQDMHDLMALYEAHRDALDRDRLAELAGKVYPRAEIEFFELLDRIDRGESISV